MHNKCACVARAELVLIGVTLGGPCLDYFSALVVGGERTNVAAALTLSLKDFVPYQ